tara:strand:- start:251 stop:670 length:420 start_codon:yes stop_codon:yes gene_type:complete
MKKLFLLIPFIFVAFVSSEDFSKEIVAATIILEAGGEYHEGSLEAINEVIETRSIKRGLSKAEVCLQRKQFSCWNGKELNSTIAFAKKHPRWGEALRIVKNPVTDYTKGSDHYHADYVNPYWASSMTKIVKIGRHIFYK